MATRDQKLQIAVNKLARYYGLYTSGDLARQIASDVARPGSTAQEQILGSPSVPANSISDSQGRDDVIATVVENFINDAEGAYTVDQLGKKFSSLLVQSSDYTKERFGKLIEIYGDSDLIIGQEAAALKNYRPAHRRSVVINSLVGLPTGNSEMINSRPNEPDKEHPNLSIVFCNSKRVAQTSRYANAVSIFLNGIPNLEISKAVPYLDVQFLFSRAPVESMHGRLQTPSLLRFLYGATTTEPGSPTRTMAMGSLIEVSSSIGRETTVEPFTTAGMEMFTSPQTLINANESDDPSRRTVQVLDKFRPFMTMQDFEVEIRGTTGMANFKSAKLSFILHDRSRLSEIAELVKPDLYGTTELLIEYGWSHPDGRQYNGNEGNPYGAIIDGMRCREKWGITNSSYTFDESGQVHITLSLFTKGSVDLSTRVISSTEDGDVGNVISDIQELQRTIAEVRARAFPNSATSAHTPEIRGAQILEASQDAISYTVLSPDLRAQLRDFRKTLRSSHGIPTPQLTRLQNTLNSLYGDDDALRRNQSTTTNGANNGVRAGGRLGALRASVIAAISRKVELLIGPDEDPFWKPSPNPVPRPGRDRSRQINTNVGTSQDRTREAHAAGAYATNFGSSGTKNKKVSLARLLLHFIGEPLASTKQYDDVQLVFYPFNEYAGFANKLNIGEFEVDAGFFVTELSRLRLSTIGRSANLNLREFLTFITQTIIDDPAAASYGLWDAAGAFFRDVTSTEQGQRAESAYEPPILQQRMENLLRPHNGPAVTPDGTFSMPQIEFMIETLPGKTPQADGVSSFSNSDKTILKIHIFDRLASSYETVGAILASARNNQLQAIGDISSTNGTDSGTDSVGSLSRENASRIMSAAQSFHLITAIENSSPKMWRITGGSRQLRDFLYQTMPYITYGSAGTLVKQANLSSMQNAAMSTTNIVRSARRTELEPNGESPGGLPLRIIPSELTMDTYGCPLLVYTQEFFVDFQTGTTADNIYGINGITHKISQGEFSTSIKFVPGDAYGKYESFMERIKAAQAVLNEAIAVNSETPTATPRT